MEKKQNLWGWVCLVVLSNCKEVSVAVVKQGKKEFS